MSTDAKLVKQIHDKIKELDTCGGVVNLGHWAFDRIPCSRRTLYAIARKHSEEWGYVYYTSEYVPSGNRPFQRNHKRGYRRNPSLASFKVAKS